MKIPSPPECVNADAQQPASGDAADRWHRRWIEWATLGVSLILAFAALITALKS